MPEVMSTFDFNQLQPNESQDQCGFAAVALCFAAGPPGQALHHPVQWAIQMMASWYTEYDGPNILSNTKGMELWQLYKLIVEKGGHYQAIDANAASIASWIEAKYPVIVAVTEDSVYDVHLKAKPYTWNTSGLSHIFTVTGIDHDHIFLCRDTVNQHDGSPYSYDGDKLSYLSATVFVPDWLPRPTSATAPHAVAPTATSGVPVGWHYNNGHLIASNNIEVAPEFIQSILTGHWNPDNTPEEKATTLNQLEVSDPPLGAGLQQIFRDNVLELPTSKGRVIEMYTGRELYATRQQVQKYYTLAVQMRDTALQLQADNAKLQTDLQAFQKALPQQ